MSAVARTSRAVPPIAAAVRLTVAARRGEDRPIPEPADLKAARALLLAEYGPCAACHPELLLATARRLRREAGRGS